MIKQIRKLLNRLFKAKEKTSKPKLPRLDLDVLLDAEKEEIKKYSEFLSEFGDNFEQKRAVISPSKRVLVLAGAGSGKTKVLTKRFIHLVKNNGIFRGNILAVTFTNEATNEMRRRIAASLEIKQETLKPNVKTFHSFCARILGENEQFTIISEKTQRDIIQKIIYSFRTNEDIMQSMYDYIKENVLEKIRIKDNQSAREPQVKSKPIGYGGNVIKTTAGILVRSKSERDIANFLTSIGLKWEYEPTVNWADMPFKPDFKLEGDVYIEHWCYDDKTSEIPGIDKKKYLKYRKWKENQFKKHQKTLISVEEREMLDLQKLQHRLKNELGKSIKKNIQEKEILELLELSPQYKKSYEKFVDEIIEIINLIKSRLLEIEEVTERIKNQEKEKVVSFYKVLIPVMEKYQTTLRRSGYGLKDFNDLIKDAVKLLKTNQKTRDYYRNKFKHLLVDEFQDVSYGQVELLKLLIDEDTYLFAVGDDWQSIYGWRGSEVEYILNFDKYFGPYEKIILPINYRSTRNIVDASTYFIKLNKKQHNKDIACCKDKLNINMKILQVNAKDDFNAARYVIHKIDKMMSEDPKLKSDDFLILIRSSRIGYGYEKMFKDKKFKIPRRTIHWSKGTECKYVFVLGLKGGLFGFPNVYIDKDIKRVILDIPLEDKEAEERRLFYVAMTRAKDRLFLISEKGNESEFVKQVPEEYKFVYSSKE